jgi:hypothetical protein
MPFKSQAERDAGLAKQKAAKTAAPAAEPTAAPAAEPTAAPAPQTAAPEQPAPAAGKKKSAPRKKAAPSQAEIDADRERIMGVTSDSIIRKGNLVAEGKIPFSFFKPR